ncbi:MAG TPA: EAL domain-containing protein [Trueperaceae bacterium]|nr:EAL domain-containing protein [Trueperaceae bacterium]
MLARLRARALRGRLLADPVRRYLVTMLVLVGIPVLLASWVLGSVIVQRLSNHMLQVAGAEVQSFIEGLLPASPGAGVASAPDPANATWWRGFGQRIMRNPTTVAVRVYDENGRIVFANNPDLIGMKPSNSAALSRALGGRRSSRLERSFLSPIERRLTSLVPVSFGPDAGSGAIEVVQDVRSLQQELRLARWLIVGGVVLLVTLFLAALVPIARRIARSAYVDPLTRLPNRRYLAELASAVLRPREGASPPVALVLIDLDRFRVVNDTLGHRVGDRLLRSVADRLQGEVRAGDYVVRHGGDEFALVLLGTDRTAAHAAASRISKALERPVEMGRRSVSPNASLGIALHPEDGASLETLLQHAEIAMYRAKSAKVPFEFYREDLNPYSREGLFLESELREAIAGGGLELVFQPIRDLVNDRLVGAEALVRWQHPRNGTMPPGAFIPLAEDTGLIRQLDRWALDRAAAQLADWHAVGLRLYVSVNLSAQTTMDRGLLDDLARTLEHTAAPPEYLLLEVTERSAIDDMESSANVLEGARSMGVQIALDDFGKGYSSLATLDRLPIGYLKIDQDFVKGIGERSKDEHLIRAIAGFSRGIGIPIIAEGIETPEQLGWLRREGIRLGQGYLLARPSSAEALIVAGGSDASEATPA